MKRKIFVAFIFILAIVLGFLIGIYQIKEKNFESNDNKINVITPSDKNVSPSNKDDEILEIPIIKERIKAKAVYMTGWSVGTKSIREKAITNLQNNGFNAVVIDIKDEAGHLSYNSEVQTAIDINASRNMIKNIKNVIQEFKDVGIYVIGRIVTFKDPTFANAKNDIAYKDFEGNLWKDYSKNAWPNPYNPSSFEYPIALAKEAASLGFDEIQFDYIRFPSSEGKVKQINYGFDSSTKTKSDIIIAFLNKVMEEVKPLGVIISADVFGITTKKDGDFENIGQDFTKISSVVDVICPMVYPSHYAKGEYKIAKPDTKPYDTVYAALKDALIRLKDIPDEGKAIVRPYLQDFSASWLGKENYILYDKNAVLAQIQACFDLGFDEFILWDPNNKYSYEALNEAKFNNVDQDEILQKLLKNTVDNLDTES